MVVYGRLNQTILGNAHAKRVGYLFHSYICRRNGISFGRIIILFG